MKQGLSIVLNLFFMMFISTILNAESSSNYFNSFYVGGNIGAAWNSANYTTLPNCGSNSTAVFCELGSSEVNGKSVATSGTGNFLDGIFSGGVQIGRNFKKNKIVLGGELDFQSFDFNKQHQETGVFPQPFLGTQYSLSQLVATKWLATTRGRLGFTNQSNLLFFMSAGAAFTNLKIASSYSDNAIDSVFTGGIGSNSQSKTRVGWTVGGGSEFYMNSNLSFKIEYIYADFGTQTINMLVSNTPSYTQIMQFKSGLNTNIARVGINYQFT